MIELAQAVERLPEVQLRIIGDGPQRHQLEAIAAGNPRIVLLVPNRGTVSLRSSPGLTPLLWLPMLRPSVSRAPRHWQPACLF